MRAIVPIIVVAYVAAWLLVLTAFLFGGAGAAKQAGEAAAALAALAVLVFLLGGL